MDGMAGSKKRYLMVATEIGFVCHHFWGLASAIQRAGWEVVIAGADAEDRQNARDAGMTLVPIRPQMIRCKGILLLVEAAKLMRSRGLEFVVYLVGDVDPRNPTSLRREDLQVLGENSPVKWLGRRSEERLCAGGHWGGAERIPGDSGGQRGSQGRQGLLRNPCLINYLDGSLFLRPSGLLLCRS